LTIAETKIDDTFPKNQFCMSGYKMYRRDDTGRSGGLLTYVRTDIPSKFLSNFKFGHDIQVLPVELNFRKCKWLLLSIYKPPRQDLKYFLSVLSDAICYYSSTYENIMIIGDFNCTPDSTILKDFLDNCDLSNVMHKKTCWKSKAGTCIDLILTNKKYSLMQTDALETGLSDHHLLVHTMLKTTFSKFSPKKIQYRCYRNFIEANFLNELSENLRRNPILSYCDFYTIFTSVLDKHAPLKTKLLRANNRPHVTKSLRKAIMHRSKLKNIANKSRNSADWLSYCRQRNLVVKLNRQAKASFFENTDQNMGKDFWKSCKPLFSENSVAGQERFLLLEDETLIQDEKHIVHLFNKYFTTITDSLAIPPVPKTTSSQRDPLDNIIESFSSHPSIVKIKGVLNLSSTFELSKVTVEEVRKEVLSLNSSKKVGGSLPIKILKSAIDEYIILLTKIFNEAIDKSCFPEDLKLADVIPIHKKGPIMDKKNYRPISLLPALSKVFERLIAKQINSFIEPYLSNFLCGFRKGYSSQHALLSMLRKWQNCVNNSGRVGALLMDLSKAFDCLPHDLLIAKLEAYGFGIKSLRFLYSYLTGRKQRVKIGCIISEWLEIFQGVPQGSVLGPILFNIFINDLLFSLNSSSVCNFADDNTLYVCDKSHDKVLERLSVDISRTISWFECNSMVANPDKFQLLILQCEPGSISVEIGSTQILNTDVVKLLGVLLDSNLSFNAHVRNIC
jgi:exonuclease III